MSGHGHFFAVERAAWPLACRLGLNPAVAFLVLARGTWRDNRTTPWSVRALESHTGISRPRAQAAIETLKAAGLLRVLRGGSTPLYDIGNGPKPPPPADDETAASRNLIWLPNSLTDGAAGETPPVELIRQTQNVNTLRLLVDLYGAQNLRDDAGIDRRLIWQAFKREKIFDYGQYVVFRFEGGLLTSTHESPLAAPFMENVKPGVENPGWPKFWDALRLLKQLGLLTFVPHVVESDAPDAEILFPIGEGGHPSEAAIARSAHRAALEMLPPNLRNEQEADYPCDQLVPVLRHIRDARMIGIGRLRYKPRTSNGLAWLGRASDWQQVADRFSAIADEIRPDAEAKQVLQR